MAQPKKRKDLGSSRYIDCLAVSSIGEELNTMRDDIMRRAYEIFDGRGGGTGGDLDDWLAAEQDLTWRPAIELTRKNGRLTLRAAVAGFNPDELDVRITPEGVLVQSERTLQPPEEGETVYWCEFAKGKLFLKVDLPARIDPERAEAEYWNGLLRVTAPVIEEPGPQRIEITEA